MRLLPLPLKQMTVVALAMFLGCMTAPAAGDSQKQMLKEAKVDRTHAEVIAVGRVHGGGVKSSKIERRNGHLVWTFEIMIANDPAVREVVVDATTGKVLSTKKKR